MHLDCQNHEVPSCVQQEINSFSWSRLNCYKSFCITSGLNAPPLLSEIVNKFRHLLCRRTTLVIRNGAKFCITTIGSLYINYCEFNNGTQTHLTCSSPTLPMNVEPDTDGLSASDTVDLVISTLLNYQVSAQEETTLAEKFTVRSSCCRIQRSISVNDVEEGESTTEDESDEEENNNNEDNLIQIIRLSGCNFQITMNAEGELQEVIRLD